MKHSSHWSIVTTTSEATVEKNFKTRAHLNLRRNLFSCRVVDKWNSLTEHEVTAPSTASFKARYDKQEAIRQLRRP